MILLRLKITNDVNSMVNNKLCADVGRQRKSRSASWIIMSILNVLMILVLFGMRCNKIETKHAHCIINLCLGPMAVLIFHRSVRIQAVSLFSWSVEKNARDAQMTTRLTGGPRFSRPSRAYTLLTKSEEKERLLEVYRSVYRLLNQNSKQR